MKKIFALFAVAALVLVGCNKKDGKMDGQLPTPPNKENHFTVTVNADVPAPNPDGDDDKVKGLGISSGNTAFVNYQIYGKAIATYEAEIDSKVSAGSSFHVDRVGTFTIVQIVDNWATIKFVPDGNPEGLVEFTGDFVTEPYADSEFCRDWTVDETIITVTGKGINDDLGVAKSFKGCSIHEISKYLREKDVNIDEQPESYSVTRLVLFETGEFAILFKGEKPFYGPFTLGKSGEFSYDFTAEDASFDEDNPIIAGSASGSFVLPGNGKGRLEINCNLESKDKKAYTANVIFFLLPA